MLRSDKVILASFFLLPLARNQNGRRAAEIVATCPYAFAKLCYTSDRLKMARIVSNSCKRMVREGLLIEVGRRPHIFVIPYKWFVGDRPWAVEYESPAYNLTEAGAVRALSLGDLSKLPSLRIPSKNRKRRKNRSNPYQDDAYVVAQSLLKLIK